MTKLIVIPDSSFFICFLDDIKMPLVLSKILNAKNLAFKIGKIIHAEITVREDAKAMKPLLDSKVEIYEYFYFEELFKPLFTPKEIQKGEHEVMIISFIFDFLGIDFRSIIDEMESRKRLKNYYPKLYAKVIGTVGFVGNYCYDNCLISGPEALLILKEIKKSKFRIAEKYIDPLIAKVSGDIHVHSS